MSVTNNKSELLDYHVHLLFLEGKSNTAFAFNTIFVVFEDEKLLG